MKRAAGLALGALASACAGPAPVPATNRIVSTNPCLDAILV